MEFKDKRVLVTGGSEGIGRTTVERFYQNGAKVFALSKTLQKLQTLKQEFPGVEIVHVDVSDWASTRQAVTQIGPVDILINNAGIASLESFLDVTEENFDLLFKVNVKSVINISQVVAKSMIENKIGGSIVNVSSVASKAALDSHTVYCASKAALDAITRSMALELGRHNIRVNSVLPTVVMTAMGRQAWSDPEKSGPVLKKIALNRFAEPNEVVETILFLASPKSSMVNGTHIPVDGGFLI